MSILVRVYRMLLLLILVLVAGCGGTADAPATDEAPQTTEGQEAEGEDAAGEAEGEDAAGETEGEGMEGETETLRLATTTSTADSGLLDAIVPDFEEAYNANVEVIAVGTGQALEIGRNGDADIILVHARAREDAFVEEGHGINRRDVMYNDFVVVGPTDDPAGIAGMQTAAEAFSAIAEAEAPFASRGDDSGTHTKERIIWEQAGGEPSGDWYNSLGQGMGPTLITANELPAYTLTDRGTFLSMNEELPNLQVVVGGDSIEENADPLLLNPYGVIPINPEQHPSVNHDLAEQFAEWLTAAETQEAIGEYGTDTFGQPLFFPGEPPATTAEE